MVDPIELVADRHGEWREQFRAERERLRGALAEHDLLDAVVRIDHVGSTAVAGLAAKDVVDVDVVVDDDAIAAVSTAVVDELGGDGHRNSEAWHPVFRRAKSEADADAGADGRCVDVHVFARSADGWRASVATREALRADADLREAYERRERELAAETDDLSEYSVGKTDLVRRAVDLARGEGEPSVDFAVPPPETVGPDQRRRRIEAVRSRRLPSGAMDQGISRRQFARSVGATAAVGATAGPATAQTERPDFGGYIDAAQGGAVEDLRGTSEVTVEVGAGSSGLAFAPTGVWIDPETTITFEWVGPGHNIVVENGPSETSWEGVDGLEGEGFTHRHTFETAGVYQYFCQPHEGQGMLGAVAVGDDVPRAGTGGREPVDPEEMGVPIQAHFVGIATILGIVISIVFAFYVLKYGESAHASSPNR